LVETWFKTPNVLDAHPVIIDCKDFLAQYVISP